jgi:hypothetical protein
MVPGVMYAQICPPEKTRRIFTSSAINAQSCEAVGAPVFDHTRSRFNKAMYKTH